LLAAPDMFLVGFYVFSGTLSKQKWLALSDQLFWLAGYSVLGNLCEQQFLSCSDW
jgi:hypothetical protein